MISKTWGQKELVRAWNHTCFFGVTDFLITPFKKLCHELILQLETFFSHNLEIFYDFRGPNSRVSIWPIYVHGVNCFFSVVLLNYRQTEKFFSVANWCENPIETQKNLPKLQKPSIVQFRTSFFIFLSFHRRQTSSFASSFVHGRKIGELLELVNIRGQLLTHAENSQSSLPFSRRFSRSLYRLIKKSGTNSMKMDIEVQNSASNSSFSGFMNQFGPSHIQKNARTNIYHWN